MSKVSDLYFTKIVTLGEGGLKDYVYFFNDLCVFFPVHFRTLFTLTLTFPRIWESVIYHILILITDY